MKNVYLNKRNFFFILDRIFRCLNYRYHNAVCFFNFLIILFGKYIGR